MKKIIMYQRAIAYIDDDLMFAFDNAGKVINFSAWIRQQAHLDFNLTINGATDIDLLDQCVVARFYKDKSEWLREKMRIHINA